MLIIPAIDLKEGRCVRLWQGIKERETVYATDPLKVAKLWFKKGARRIHIVDLDGAFSGKPKHLEIAQTIKDSLPVAIQYGGGIRSIELLEDVLKRGIDFAIVGTKALSMDFIKEAIRRFNDRIIVSIDSKEGKVAIKGWQVKTRMNVQELGKKLATLGVKTIILTDITKDGTLEGINIDFLNRFAKNIPCDLIIAGGVSSLENIRKIRQIDKKIIGVIIGKALYSGNINLEDALEVAKDGTGK